MKTIILSILLVLFTLTTMAQVKRALVIGIGDYPSESGWSKINGDRDINIVCAFLSDNGFAQTQIVKLKNDQATKANILHQFKSITKSAKSGDQIYIHFSGHGQQITDTNGDEDDGYDEAWIPYDARKSYAKGIYEGENHLVDDQINVLLRDIRKRIGPAGQLTVVVDACHSGDSSRGEEEKDEDLIVRGTPDRFIIPSHTSKTKATKQPIQWVMISACKAYQNNYECKVGNIHYGSLSYALYLQRNDVGGKSLDLVGQIIAQTLSQLITRPQTIQIDSKGNLSEETLFEKR